MRSLLCLLLFAMTSGLPAQVAPPQQGTVLFSRDRTSTQNKMAAPAEKEPAVAVTDAERNSLTLPAYDLDVHLTPAESGLAVHARFTAQNSGTQPLTRLVFQLSSSLHWQSVGLETPAGISPLTLTEHTINTDLDHTGKASEAVVALPQPLAPGASVKLSAFYTGKVEQSANRLDRIGAPAGQAALADWDRISPELTALRGFGDVLWYPVASAPEFLGDGAKLFQTVGRSRLAQSTATVRLRLTVVYVGEPPDAAYFCGRREQLAVVTENQNLPVVNAPGIATAEFAAKPLGFRPLSLFVTPQPAAVTANTLIGAVTNHEGALPNYAAAAAKVEPLLKDWLGAEPLTMLNIIDLNLVAQNGQPFEDDALLVAPLRTATPDALAPSLVHSLSHAWFRSSHQWLDEGVPEFMALLWLERSQGRSAAIAQLQSKVNALSLAEPALKDDSTAAVGQSLIDATGEVYYRTKAASVLWMLRSIVGDAALKNALQTYRHADKDDEDPEAFQRVLEASAHRDLRWFFNDWVYRDRGLPDLTIASVTPRLLQSTQLKGASWLVAVDVRNNGYAAAEVPVTVRSGELTITHRLRIAGRSDASTRILFAGVPEEVIVNDGSVPEMTASSHTKQIAVH